MKKNAFLFMPLFCSALFAVPLSGAEKKDVQIIRSVVNADDFQEPEKAAQLFDEREKLILKIHTKRQEIIKKDPRMKNLQAQILSLSRELGIAVDSNREIQQLKEKISSVDSRINNLEKKKKR